MYLFRQPTSGTGDIRKREVSDDIDSTVAGKFWLLIVFRTNSGKYLEDSSSCQYTSGCLSKKFEFCLQEKQVMTLLLRQFLSQRNTDQNKFSSLFYTALSGGQYRFPKSLLIAM